MKNINSTNNELAEWNQMKDEGEKLYRSGEMKRAHEFFLKCEQLSLVINNKEIKAESLKNVGRTLFRFAKYQEAKEKLKKSLEILEEMNLIEKKPQYLLHLSTCYQMSNEFKTQKELLDEAVEIAKKSNDEYVLAKLYNSYGSYYSLMGQFQQAKDAHETAIKFLQKLNIEGETLARTYNMLANLLIKLKRFGEAEDLLKMAAIEAKKGMSLADKAYDLFNRIMIHYIKGEFSSAEGVIEDFLKIEKKLENRKSVCDLYRIAGLVHKTRDNDKVGKEFLLISLQEAKKIEYSFGIALAYEELGNLSLKGKNYLESFRNFINSLRSYQFIFTVEENKDSCEMLETLTKKFSEILDHLNDIIDNPKSTVVPSEISETLSIARNVCKNIKKEKDLLDFTKFNREKYERVKTSSENVLKSLAQPLEEWKKKIPGQCLEKLLEKNKQRLAKYKLFYGLPQDCFEECIILVSKIIESEVKNKIFSSFRNHWEKNLSRKNYDLTNLAEPHDFEFRDLKFAFGKIIDYLYDKKSLELGPITAILDKIVNIKNLEQKWSRFPDYLAPFSDFHEFLGKENTEKLRKVVKFNYNHYKAGPETLNFIKIRNYCSHGEEEETGNKKEITNKKELLEQVEKNLIDANINLISNLCQIQMKTTP